MRFVPLAVFVLAGLLVARTAAHAGPSTPWRLPRDREVYLMEDDLVYARFLRLARGGAYSQINRDEHGSTEGDRGRWDQDKTGTLRLHSTCRALRPRALSSAGLSVALTDAGAFDGLPRLLASMQHFLAVYPDTVFDAATMAEINQPGAPTVHASRDAATFDRRDAAALVARIEAALAGERGATYLLEPVENVSTALFALQGSVFGAADLAGVRRAYRVADRTIPPFYFAWIDAKTYAAEVGRWQPLRLPGGGR